MTKMLIFEIEAELGLFKKYYTTASLLTFDFPPKTSVIGVIGAILGYGRDSEEMVKLQSTKLGLEIINPIRKFHQGVNWLNTKVRGKGNIQESTEKKLGQIMAQSALDAYGFIGDAQYKPTNLQLLINPRYRIFVLDNQTDSFNKLVNAIANHEYVYTPYLGQTEHIANLEYIDLVDVELMKENNAEMYQDFRCVIPEPAILVDAEGNKAIQLTVESKIVLETLPKLYVDQNTIFERFVYNKTPEPLNVSVNEFYQIKTSKFESEIHNIVVF